jgi:hypothetical protein
MSFMTGMTRIMKTMFIWHVCDDDRADARFAIWRFGYGKPFLVEDKVRLDRLTTFHHCDTANKQSEPHEAGRF